MSQQVRVSKDLQFVGTAKHTDNVEGPMSLHMVTFCDDFLGVALDSTNDWTVAGVNSGTAAIAAPHMMTLTTGAADDDDVDVASALNWYGQYNACLEVRARIDDVDKTAINIGFSDATGEAADKIPMMLSGATPTLTSTASDFVGFCHDADATTTVMTGVSVKGDADGALISGAAETDASWFTVRVELIDNGTTTDAVFYYNASGNEISPADDRLGIELDAVTRTTPLCIYIGLINHGEDAANTLDVDYVKAWQDRS